MQALFGVGLHPLAEQRQQQLQGPDLTSGDYIAVTRLGAPFKVYANDIPPFRVEIAKRIAELNAAAGLPRDWPVPPPPFAPGPAAAFTHRDSRAGDPDLHTHVAVANKVQTLDGRWLSIDGRILFKATVAASETYNTALENHLRDSLGLRFAERPNKDPRKRPIRESSASTLP
jgi:hypothetical protein